MERHSTLTTRRFPEILHEDNHVIVVRKPAGMLSQADETQTLDVLSGVRDYIRQRDGKPGNVFLGLLHRLDRPVGGVMLLAKTSKAASRISACFRNRRVHKRYLAVVEGRWKTASGELNHCLQWNPKERMTAIVQSGGRDAHLRYTVRGYIAQPMERTLLEIILVTGVHHQIRAQVGVMGHPVLGDRKYGSRVVIPNRRGVIALHCVEMVFPHPVGDSEIRVCCPPEDFWPFPSEL